MLRGGEGRLGASSFVVRRTFLELRDEEGEERDEGASESSCPDASAPRRRRRSNSAPPAPSSTTSKTSATSNVASEDAEGSPTNQLDRRHCALPPSASSSSPTTSFAGGYGGYAIASPSAFDGVSTAPPTTPCAGESSDSGRTTLLLRRVPYHYNRDLLALTLRSLGLDFAYDFLYVPMDFATRRCYGYAVVNVSSPMLVSLVWSTFQGFTAWFERAVESSAGAVVDRTPCSVTWAEPYHGLYANLLVYRNSTLMHSSVDDIFKPAVYWRGQRLAFPEPTVVLRQPKARRISRTSKRSAPRGSANLEWGCPGADRVERGG